MSLLYRLLDTYAKTIWFCFQRGFLTRALSNATDVFVREVYTTTNYNADNNNTNRNWTISYKTQSFPKKKQKEK